MKHEFLNPFEIPDDMKALLARKTVTPINPVDIEDNCRQGESQFAVAAFSVFISTVPAAYTELFFRGENRSLKLSNIIAEWIKIPVEGSVPWHPDPKESQKEFLKRSRDDIMKEFIAKMTLLTFTFEYREATSVDEIEDIIKDHYSFTTESDNNVIINCEKLKSGTPPVRIPIENQVGDELVELMEARVVWVIGSTGKYFREWDEAAVEREMPRKPLFVCYEAFSV